MPEPVYRYCPRCASPLSARCVKAGEPERLCCDGCEFIFYLDPKTAAGVIATVDGRVLLLKRGIEPAYGAWVFPGGFVDRGEHPADAARREAREEAGVEVEIEGLLGVYSHPEGSPVVLIVYHGRVVRGEPAALDESLDFGLFALDELPWDELAFSTTRQAAADYTLSRGLPPPPMPQRVTSPRSEVDTNITIIEQ